MSAKKNKDEIGLLKHAYEFLIPKFHEAHGIMTALLDFQATREVRFVDLGCGFGDLSKALLMNFLRATVFGIDNKAELIASARASLSEFDSRFIGFERDMTTVSWVEGLAPLDAVVSSFTLDYLTFPQHEKIVAEAFELLSPMGRWISCEFYQSHDPRVNRVFHDLEIQFVQNSVRAGHLSHDQIDRIAKSLLLRKQHYVCGLDSKIEWMKKAGFQNVDVPWRFLNLAVVSGVKP
jgi:ubiquinone/menaquinone biosynthesis C-methylase UbiE